MLLDDSLYAVVSLPAGVFNPYSGVKTSILFLDKQIAKKNKDVLFVKVEADGYNLGAQRREIKENDLPLALEILQDYQKAILLGEKVKLEKFEKQIAHIVSKDKIKENGYNLSGDRYKEEIVYDGNWDLVGNNTPVFFIKDPKKFPDFIHTQKRDPKTNCKSPTMMCDYWSLNPESLHQVLILMSDRGIPDGYRHMNGYGSHTFSLVNKDNERFYVKFHYKTMQGIKNLTAAEAEELKGKDPDYAQRDLVNAIENKNFPKYALKIQVMTIEQAKEFQWNPDRKSVV